MKKYVLGLSSKDNLSNGAILSLRSLLLLTQEVEADALYKKRLPCVFNLLETTGVIRVGATLFSNW